MKAVIAWWDLAESDQTTETLREFLRDEAVERFSRWPGLRMKFWISDAGGGGWGAVFLWESEAAASRPLPTRAADLIGYPPTVVHRLNVEAATEGEHTIPDLTGLGLAFAR
ncbi:hypothetical protein ACGF4C_20680 [Streptomyces sp. NPDC048197]|uniref:hypothetical protein n=1 Tax=Streptomyces sp. NPDC048197 TaxID=3365511 RepID=UPI00370FD054